MTASQSVPAHMKGFNRVAIVDQNFIEFVRAGTGTAETHAAPDGRQAGAAGLRT